MKQNKDRNYDKDEQKYHTAVLLHECIRVLNIQPSENYLDATFGGGGHSEQILKKLDQGKLIAFDQDEDAAHNLLPYPQLIFVRENFKYAHRFARLYHLLPLHGILADLGVSSHQFDTAERGFSIRFDAELDMRMDRRQSLTAAQILNTYSEEQLHKLFEKYGEVTNAKSLARKICEERKNTFFKTTEDFIEKIRPLIREKSNKYLAKVFQALRIEVNDELEVLRSFLQKVIPLLKVGGRIAIITFHSLEDQVVKQVFRQMAAEEWTEEEKLLGRKTKNKKSIVLKIGKTIKPQMEEIIRNGRARSAKLRFAERIE